MKTITIRVSTPLRKFIGGHHEVQVPAQSVDEALQRLSSQYPDLQGRLTDADGALREFIQIHVGRMPLRQFGGPTARLKPGDVISVSSPFSGG
jgi:molybdopterin converting factor small subunit